MRTDINLSVRMEGTKAFGTRTEMKNMNSFKAISRAIEYETRRQTEILEAGGEVSQETRRWDENRGRSFAMRSKENARDYRYFPEPDLPPVEIDDDWYGVVKRSLPELAPEKARRYTEAYGLPAHDAGMITSQKVLADFFEKTVSLGAAPKEVSNWIMGDLSRILKDKATPAKEMRMTPERLARIIELIDTGVLGRNKGREVLEAVFDTDGDIDEYVAAHNLLQISDESTIESAVARILAENQNAAEEYKSGKTKVFGYLMGQTMHTMNGKADPSVIKRILQKKLK